MCSSIDTQDPLLFLQLDPPEIKWWPAPYVTKGDLSTDDQLARRFRHGGWHRVRQLIYDSLRRTLQTPSRVANFNDCGSCAYVYQSLHDPAKFRLGGSSCRDRFCVPCSLDRSRCLATNVIKTLGNRPARFITLTLLQTDACIRDVLDKLHDSFRHLRASTFWKRHVKGGCAFIEIKHNHQRDQWNVHLHAIVHGTYIDKFQLAKKWHEVTGDSYIVRVILVRDEGAVGRYVVKYCSKPFNNTFINRWRLLDQVVHATVRRRLCLTFGDWRGIRLTETPNSDDWIPLGSFHAVVTAAVAGERDAIAAVHAICRDDADAILSEVQHARPPPPNEPLVHRQLRFYFLEPLIQEIT